ncbi:hypothetical protein B0F90DRAFT_1693763 [Multifurca ochricompacta]|uniref:Rho-GAP domain-containing protein n=1 Tax=Multifurca ochricompacta TaxID=376703 RepID=A0AAD4QR82_9AGAM|nr:hypothetical protein B0F90DRAFT_1693763 [Multifurca ochricompacta]
MAVLSLPLSFTNSFWTQDYRRGLEVLYSKLEQVVPLHTCSGPIMLTQTILSGRIGEQCALPRPHAGLIVLESFASGTGFSADDGATLLMAFRGLQAETAQQGGLHQLVADPFEQWAASYHERLQASRATIVDGHVKNYEQAQTEVLKLKNTYFAKVRKADETEEDAKFAPNSELSDKYTTSPRLVPQRIAQRFKDIQRKASNFAEGGPKVDKGKGKVVEEPSDTIVNASPPSISPQLSSTNLVIKTSSSPAPPEPPEPILLAGLSLPPAAISDLLTRASAELKLRPIRFPIVGEYLCFTGEEFVIWLNENVQGFGGSFDRAEQAARELTERDGLLRRIGDLGNAFEPVDDAFYQFRPKAFELGKPAKQETPLSPTKLAPVAGSLIKRSNNFLNVVSKALATNPNAEPPHVRARLEADAADREYRISVRKLDRQRLGLEERIEDTLKVLQRWETERLHAVKAVLLQFHGTLSNLPRALETPLERSASHIAAYLPDSDLSALIERYRTGPFRPQPQVYESVSHDESDVLFGIDLRKWFEGGWSTLHAETPQNKPVVPPVLTALLDSLNQAYPQLPNDGEKRKAWIYEVPLAVVHHLRESLNAVPPEQPIPGDIMTKYDPPVLASAVKLWLLELDPPIALWEGWEDLRRLYPMVPSVGSTTTKGERESTDEHERLEALKVALLRLPKIHLYVLDAIVLHLRTLIDNTKVEEIDEVYVTKLALSIGRTILRPKVETSVSVQDRHAATFFVDLIKHYADVLPPTIAKKKADTERKVPSRKRTAPVDLRMSRSRLSVGTDAREWLASQRAQGNVQPPVPPVPPVSRISEPAPASTPSVAQPHPTPPPEVKPKPAPEPPQLVAPVPVIAARVADASVPARPPFKSPPPEEDELPPRPAFTSPPPESDPESPPPVTPAAAPVKVSPPTPKRRNSGSPRPSPARTSTPRVRSPSNSSSPLAATGRSPSPAISQSEDAPLNPNRASLSRVTSSTEASRIRPPRGSRPPRGGGSVSSIVSNLNRNSASSDPRTSPPPSAGLQRGGRVRPPSAIFAERRSSLTGLARRTMDSDAEEGVVG